MGQALNQDELEQEFFEASRCLLDNRLQQAFERFEALSKIPHNPAELACEHNWALCMEVMGETERAAQAYERILYKHPAYERSMLGLNNCLKRLGCPASHRLQALCRGRSLQSRRMLSQCMFEVRQDYNLDAIAMYVELASGERMRATEHYTQCHYENMLGKEYWLTEPLPSCPRSPSGEDPVVMLTSAAYVLLTLNSVLSMRRHARKLARRVFVYCLDMASARFLRKYDVPTAVWFATDVKGLATYCQTEFNRLTRCKIVLLDSLLKDKASVTFVDSDVVFLKDPSRHVRGTSFQADGPGIACTGFMRLYPGAAPAFDPMLYPPECGDQPTCNYLLKNLDVKFTLLPDNLFQNGLTPVSDSTVMKHYNYMLTPQKLDAMHAEGCLFVATSSLQMRILCETASFRPPSHSNSGYNGPWIEQVYYEHWIGLMPKTSRVYLPVFWTDMQVLDGSRLADLATYVCALPKDKSYFTVCQHASGLGIDVGDLDLHVFRSGCPGEGGTVIPLLKKELELGREVRSTRLSFVGTVNPDNDFEGIRLGLREQFPSAVHYNGANWASVLQDSVFSLCPRGFGPTSFRVCESIQAGAIPVIVWSRELVLPYPNLKWNEFAVVLRSDEASESRLVNLDVDRMSKTLESVRYMFTYFFTTSYVSKLCIGADVEAPTK